MLCPKKRGRWRFSVHRRPLPTGLRRKAFTLCLPPALRLLKRQASAAVRPTLSRCQQFPFSTSASQWVGGARGRDVGRHFPSPLLPPTSAPPRALPHERTQPGRFVLHARGLHGGCPTSAVHALTPKTATSPLRTKTSDERAVRGWHRPPTLAQPPPATPANRPPRGPHLSWPRNVDAAGHPLQRGGGAPQFGCAADEEGTCPQLRAAAPTHLANGVHHRCHPLTPPPSPLCCLCPRGQSQTHPLPVPSAASVCAATPPLLAGASAAGFAPPPPCAHTPARVGVRQPWAPSLASSPARGRHGAWASRLPLPRHARHLPLSLSPNCCCGGGYWSHRLSPSLPLSKPSCRARLTLCPSPSPLPFPPPPGCLYQPDAGGGCERGGSTHTRSRLLRARRGVHHTPLSHHHPALP